MVIRIFVANQTLGLNQLGLKDPTPNQARNSKSSFATSSLNLHTSGSGLESLTHPPTCENTTVDGEGRKTQFIHY